MGKKNTELKNLKGFKLDPEKVKDIQACLKGGSLAVELKCVPVTEANRLDGSYLYD